MTLQGENAIVWLLIDDRAGNRSQVLGVGRALGFPFEIKNLEYTAAAALPNYMHMASFSMVTRKNRVNLAAPWPDIVIAAGRRTAPVARRIKELNKGKTFLVQIMYPGSNGEDDFSLIAVPRHDSMPPASNRFEVIGAPHGVTPQSLAEARLAWAGRFDHLPSPRVALIVGGDTKRRTFTTDMARELGERAAALARKAGGSLLISTSRRTSSEAAQVIMETIGDIPAHTFKWGDEGDNPYMAYLAYADHVIVTGDSVSMCCEACAVGRPVAIFAPKKLCAHKHAKLHKDLYARGYARALEDVETLSDEVTAGDALNAAFDIAAEIKSRLYGP